MHLDRRLWTIGRTYALLLVVLALLPVLALSALTADLVRWVQGHLRFVTMRLVAFALVYLLVEALMLPRLGLAWLRWRGRPQTLLAVTAAQQQQFAGVLFRALLWLFQVRLEVRGTDCAVPGPIVLLVRHTSIADTLLPTVLLSRKYGIGLRFVLKQELLLDPCLDIAGNRLPNLFVSRRRENAAHDLAAITHLATDMGPLDGVLIYPEGTRYTVQKRNRAVADLQSQHPELARVAQSWQHVMPPKPGGVLAALQGAPTADVVWMAHTGLEGLADIAAIWRGDLVGKTVRVELWRTPRGQVPVEKPAQVAWLFHEWQVMENWVDAEHKVMQQGGL